MGGVLSGGRGDERRVRGVERASDAGAVSYRGRGRVRWICVVMLLWWEYCWLVVCMSCE